MKPVDADAIAASLRPFLTIPAMLWILAMTFLQPVLHEPFLHVVRLAALAAAAIFPAAGISSAAAESVVRPDVDPSGTILYMSDIVQNGAAKQPSSSNEGSGASGNERTGSPHDGNLSGSAGDGSVQVMVGNNTSLPNPTSFYALTGLGIEERGNDPCLLRLYGTLVDPRYQGPVRVVARETMEDCRSLLPGVDNKNVSFSKSERFFDFRVDGKHFIRRLQVCGGRGTLLPQQAYTHQMWKIKGVRIVASEVRLAYSPLVRPEVLERGTTEEFIRANCPDRIVDARDSKPGWSQWSECPTGQVATGMRVHHGENRYFTGLQLICKDVSYRRIDAPPRKDDIGY